MVDFYQVAAICDSAYVSSGMSSSPRYVPLGGENFMLRKLIPFKDGSVRDKLPCCRYATFLIERIIRETITGRYLEPAVSRLNE